ncbi:MAG: XRE family transcriptional regulator [Rubrivivax sp.]|nr:MAG: XRE family transcriptional regulator [Rubrivivax sp.]
MSRINFDDLPLTSDQARAARNFFGWSQKMAAEESGLPPHKLKRFEAGNFIPDVEFLAELRAFFEKRGYKFDDTPQPGAKAKETGMVFPAGVVGSPEENQGSSLGSRVHKSSLSHIRIALPDTEMGHVLDLIEENEEKVQGLLSAHVQTGVFDRFSDKAEATHGEVLRLLAENGLLFAKLLGREVGGKPAPELLRGDTQIKTHADLLHRTHADVHLAASGDVAAKERRKGKPLARSLSSAIFG